PLGAARDGADRVHATGVAMPAVENERHVDVDDVALAQRLVVGDTVADHVVDGGAGRLAVAAIHQGRGQRLVGGREVENQPVDLLGRYAGPDLAVQHVEAFGGQPPRPAHALEGSRAVQLDLSGFSLRRQYRVDVAHVGWLLRGAAVPSGRSVWL